MALYHILEYIGKLWVEWNIRGFMMLSLFLQIFLILFSPFRKRTSNMLISVPIWLAYLSADWVATSIVGHIAFLQRDISNDRGEIMVFWAAFVLVHLGGPGTITALNLEDNSLWIRHMFTLILQVGSICYIFARGRVMSISNLVVPTILVFISGFIKYSERIAALYLASIGKLKDSMLKDSLKHMNGEPNGETKEQSNYEQAELRNDSAIVEHAYHFYEGSKGVIVDLMINFNKHANICEFFRRIDPDQALKLISVELNFFYEVLYTKASVSHTSWGLFFRCLSFGTITVALVWFLQSSKDSYSKFDVKLSYALLFGGIAFDGIGLLLILFSDWPVPKILCFGKASRAGSRIKSYFTIQKLPNWVLHRTRYKQVYHSLAETLIVYRRWSESIPQYSLISFALGRRSERMYIQSETCFAFSNRIQKLYDDIISILPWIAGASMGRIVRCLSSISSGIVWVTRRLNIQKILVMDLLVLVKEFFDRLKYVSKEPLSKELWGFIFMELQKKSKPAGNSNSPEKNVFKSRGDFSFEVNEAVEDHLGKVISDIIRVLYYDEMVLLWHIATELLYHSELWYLHSDDDFLAENNRIFGKILSDYMLYLLVKKPTMMSTVARAGQIRYRDAYTDTISAAKKLLEDYIEEVANSPDATTIAPTIHALVCRDVLEYNEVEEPDPKGRSVWSKARILAKELECLADRKKMWKIIAAIWVQVLSYAASHCKGEAHAEALGSGGELLTLVWLLMFHLGLSQQESIEIQTREH